MPCVQHSLSVLQTTRQEQFVVCDQSNPSEQRKEHWRDIFLFVKLSALKVSFKDVDKRED